MLRLALAITERSIGLGDTAIYGLTLDGTDEFPSPRDVHVESDHAAFEERWVHVIADAEERAGTRRYSIQICPPKGLRHAYGKYECRLTIGEGGDGPSARTDFVLMVQPCVRARGRPKLRVSASGALSVSVPLFNCSGVDLSASFELVPKRGSPQRWDFDLKSDPPFFEYQLDDINGHYRWFARFGLNVTAEDVFVLKQRVSFFSAGSRVRRWISDLPSKVIGIVLALIVGAAATVIGILLAHTSPARISVPTHIDCGTAAVYGQAICPSIVVTNVGSGVVTLGRVVSASAAFAVSSTTCTRPLAPNSTCHVAVTFDPPATGLTTGLVTIGRGSLARSSDVVLTGVGESLGSAPKFTSAASGGFEGTFVVTSTGQPTPTLSVLGALPSWLHFSTIRGGDALLSGTPPAGTSGPVTVRVLANNGVQPEASQNLVLEVAAPRSPPTITSAAGAVFPEGSLTTFVVTTGGDPPPAVTTMGTLPIWLRFTPTPNGAVLAGDPPVEDDTTQAYSIPIVIEAASTGGPAAVQDFNVEVPPSCQLDDSDSSRFTSPMDATFTLDRPEWFAVSACASRLNVAAPSVGESGALPSWLAFAPGKSSGTLGLGTAVISGTPPANAARTYSFELTIDDGPSSAEPVSEQFTLTVVPPAGPKFTSADTANFFVDQLSRFTVVSAGSPTPSLTIGDHPPWLDLEVFGGQATISGLPPSGSSDDYLITISAQNGVGSPVTQMLSIHVSGGPSGTTGTATTSGPSGTTGTVTTSGPSGTTGG